LDSKDANCFYIQLNAHWLTDGNGKPAEALCMALWRICNGQPQQKSIKEPSADSPKTNLKK
jgi:5-hydroxyisourate hydrolase-like protein (transthyretin family)